MTNVNDLVAEMVEKARRKAANDKRRRDDLNMARQYGIAARHRQKLARLDQLNNSTPAASAA